MIYVKLQFCYGNRLHPTRMRQLIDNCAINPPVWTATPEGNWEMPYNCELIIPIKMAELIGGESKFLGSYTSEELAPLHEDKLLFNAKVGAAQPNAALWGLTEVMVQTDLCTDSLRGYLEDGWHILAICPQPKQRRPDYVLGKGATPPQQSYSGCEKIEIQLLAPSAPVEGDDTPF